jgi:uncharacterized OB-fold protein
MSTSKGPVPVDPSAIVFSADGSASLVGGKCARCGRAFFPKREICPLCFDQGIVEQVLLGPRGKLVDFTVVYRAPGREVPYALGYIRVDEGLLLLAPLTECDPERLAPGMDVEIVFETVEGPGEEEIITFRYKPA